jgi:protein kinase-like protein
MAGGIHGLSETVPSPATPGEGASGISSDAGGCLSEDEVLAYVGGEASAPLRDEIHLHLDACQDCWALVQATLSEEPLPEGWGSQPFRVTTFPLDSLIAERYRIQAFIGRGGMGEVYRAHDRLMNKVVALKTPLCTSGDDPSALRKFFDEVRNADRITHSNICRIYALQEHRDAARPASVIPFFTMEFIEGETLAARLKRGALPLPEALSIARQLLEGLRAAHAKRVLHLDFKSENVMLRQSGQLLEAVIMDFGLSRERDAILRTSQCQRGIGTLPYMALEQLEGRRNLLPSTDVYAFGVVLYEMLTGRLPFLESSFGAMLVKQLRARPPAPSSLRPELSAAVDAFVSKCLSRAPVARYEDAGATLAAFERLSRWTGPRARHAAPVLRRVPLLLLLGLGLVLGAVGDDSTRAEAALEDERAAARPLAQGPPAEQQIQWQLAPAPAPAPIADVIAREQKPRAAPTPPAVAQQGARKKAAPPRSEPEAPQPSRRTLRALPSGLIPFTQPSAVSRQPSDGSAARLLERIPIAQAGPGAVGPQEPAPAGARFE